VESARGHLTGTKCRFLAVAAAGLAAAVLAVAGPATLATPVAAATVKAAHKHNRHHHRKHHRRHARRHHGVKGHTASARTASASGSTPAALVPTPPCANADTPATQGSVDQMRIAVECLVNQERTSRGLPALADDSKLTTSAQSWTDEMVATGDFTHGTNFAGRINAVGYDWQEAGENIATGYETPRDVVQAWMQSPEHCQNILQPDYTEMGTGVNTAPVGNFASGPSTWTQDFGLTMSQTAPSSNQGPMNGCPYAN
jgi:uncharacterized protein YkwD